MVINFLSIRKIGAHVVYEIAAGTQRQNHGSFAICSVVKNDSEPPAGITGTISGAVITLSANGKPLLHRLRMGNKSIKQLRLWLLGYHIPHTVALDFSVYEAFKREEKFDLQELFERVIAPRLGSHVAIRCSSNCEDSDAQSFAGAFDTYLDVPNLLDEIQGKITRSYDKFCPRCTEQKKTFHADVRLSIMIQQMIRPTFSGFLFTLHPVNPPSDWLKIEYWQGPREKSDEYSLTLSRKTGKQVSSDRDSNQIPLPKTIHEKLHDVAVKLECQLGTPQDIEFLISGSDDTLYVVQARPITAFSYSPEKVRVDEQKKLSAILDENRRYYRQDPVLSSTNISELFPRAIPLGYSIFKYGFAGTPELEGGVSIGRRRLGYARLAPEDGARLYYTVADQARTNIIVDALTFRLPGISKREYIDIFVKHYLEQIERDSAAANYPEDGLYLQTDDEAHWVEIIGTRGKRYYAEFSEFLQQITHVHAPREYGNAVRFFRRNERHYNAWLNCNLQVLSSEDLRHKIEDILSYLRTTFCPKYVVYARLAFLCTHLAKVRLGELLTSQSRFTPEEILNNYLHGVLLPPELEEPRYPEFEHLYKRGKISLVEFLAQFQHLGSLDISQLRLGEYPPEKLSTVFGPVNPYGFDDESLEVDNTELIQVDIAELEYEKDTKFQLLYTNGARFMLLREKAKSALLKLLWALKRIFIEIAQRNRFSDLIYYLELDEALMLMPENRDALRVNALQRKAFLETCRQHRVEKVLLDLQSTPFKKNLSYEYQDGTNLYRFIHGKTICHGYTEGICLTASNNEEFIVKLASYREKNIENIVGVFKGIELSYFNMSALVGFATENGGFLSHAATIAREFRLPYISDIRFDQFRDEDYVILDTENDQVIIRR